VGTHLNKQKGDKSIMEEIILNIIREESLINDSIEINMDIFDIEIRTLGFTSISYVKMLVLIEMALSIEFPMNFAELYNFNSLREIIVYIKENLI
jgi:acyl carrier protein